MASRSANFNLLPPTAFSASPEEEVVT